MKKIVIGIVLGVILIFGAAGMYNAGRSASVARPRPVTERTESTVSTETTDEMPEPEPEPDVPRDYTAALESARSYSKHMHMSKMGIYSQLTSSAEQFAEDAAQYAIDQLDLEVDWKANALESARNYSKHMHMSTQGIYDQLTSSAEQFTPEEAQYAIDNL